MNSRSHRGLVYPSLRVVPFFLVLSSPFLLATGSENLLAQERTDDSTNTAIIETGAEAMRSKVSLHQNAKETSLALEDAQTIASRRLQNALLIFGEPNFDISFVLREEDYKSSARVFPTSQESDGRKMVNIHVKPSSFDDDRTWSQINSWWLGQAFPRLLTAQQKEGLCGLVEGKGQLPEDMFSVLSESKPMPLDEDLNPLEVRPRRAGKELETWQNRTRATRVLVCWYWLSHAGAESLEDFPKMKLPDIAQAWKDAQKTKVKSDAKRQKEKTPKEKNG